MRSVEGWAVGRSAVGLGWLLSLALLSAGCGGAAKPSASAPPTVAVTRSAPAPVSCPEPRPAAVETPKAAQPMSDARLDAWLKQHARVTGGRVGAWQIEHGGRALLLLTDETHDRMRIVTPVIEASQLSAEQIGAVLVANFHTALDARYAVHDAVLYAAFIHPLSSLSEADLRSALKQVATLADNFGSSYSSGELVFGQP